MLTASLLSQIKELNKAAQKKRKKWRRVQMGREKERVEGMDKKNVILSFLCLTPPVSSPYALPLTEVLLYTTFARRK